MFEVRTGDNETVAIVDSWWTASRIVTHWQDSLLQQAWIRHIRSDEGAQPSNPLHQSHKGGNHEHL